MQKSIVNLLFIGRFMKHINTETYCNIGDIIDLNETNRYLKQYNICLVDYYNFTFNIESATYGTKDICVNVKDNVRQCLQNNIFKIEKTVNLNDMYGNPHEICKKKYGFEINKNNIKLTIGYSFNNIKFYVVYDTLNGYLKNDIIYDCQNPVFYPSRIHNDLTIFSQSFLHNITFNKDFTQKAKQYMDTIINLNYYEQNKINCIHMRLEDDAVEHWAKENKLPPGQFKTIVENMYIEKIKTSIQKNEKTVILTYDYNNKVIEFLRENNYDFYLPPKMDSCREIAAVYDMEIGRYCNNVYILVYDSSFSYTLLFRMNRRVIQPIQLHYILE